MNKEKIKAYLKELNKYEYIKVQDTDKERLIFKQSQEVFNIFGHNDGYLTPFDDYSYEWLNNFIFHVIDLLEYCEFEDLENLEQTINDNLYEWADSEVYNYTSDLTEWLNSSNHNVSYMSEVLSEYGQQEDGFKLLSMAQNKAITDHFNNYARSLIKHLNEEFEEE